jgi:DNA ligase (NAD+)
LEKRPAKTLARSVNHLLDFQNYSLEDLQNLEDIGPKVGGSIYHFFRNKDNIKMLQQLEKLGLKLKNEKKEQATGGNPYWTIIFIYRHLPTLKRSEAGSNGGGKWRINSWRCKSVN